MKNKLDRKTRPSRLGDDDLVDGTGRLTPKDKQDEPARPTEPVGLTAMVSIRLPAALVGEAKHLARTAGITLTDLVRSALEAEVQVRKKGLREFLQAELDRLEGR